NSIRLKLYTLGGSGVMRRPFRPNTVLRIKRLWPHARGKGHERGQLYRVGYYSRQDGLDCVWLVNSHGEYNWIDPIELIAGSLPKRQQRLVEAWAELHQSELV